MTPEGYYTDSERIAALVAGAVVVVAVVLLEQRVTRGLDRWLWWRP